MTSRGAVVAAGLLVAASVDSSWTVDPYRLYLLASSVTVAATVRLNLERGA